MNTTHDFYNCLVEALRAIDELEFDEKWGKVLEAARMIDRAGSLASITGPLSVDKAARQVVADTRVIVEIRKDKDTLSATVRAWKAGRPFEKLDTWIVSVSDFSEVGRRVLKTQ